MLIRSLALLINIFISFDFFLIIRFIIIGSICISLETKLKLDGAVVTPKILPVDG